MPIDLVRLDQNIHKCISDLFGCNGKAFEQRVVIKSWSKSRTRICAH